MLSLPAVLILAASGVAAPPEKAPRWEYAELAYRNIPARPKGVDANGNEVDAVPPSMSIRWTTGAGEATFKGWGELAEKLKNPVTKDGSAALHKIQALNALGGEGWEVVDQQAGSGVLQMPDRGTRGFTPGVNTTLLFKRRVP
jgi:hypothetical protein